MTLVTTVNPATGCDIETYAPFSDERIAEVVEAVTRAQSAWALRAIEERAQCLRRIAARIRQERASLASMIVTEMGKPITEALGEVDKCAWVFEFYAEKGPEFLTRQPVSTDAHASWVCHEPLGVILAIMPWNFPWWQAARFAAPALLAGNGALLKHSPNVTGCALDIEHLFRQAGLDDNVFRTLVIDEPRVPAAVQTLLSDPRVAAVSLTGSERAGAAVASAAGAQIKKCVLELGGSDPFVVLDDAALELAVDAAIKSRFINGGQSCLAAKRFIVHEDIYTEFVALFAQRISDLIVGDPLNERTQIGPMARPDLVDELHRQISQSVDAGAKVEIGGNPIERAGSWHEPTLLSQVTLEMPVMREETFGGAAAVLSFGDDDAAVSIANATRYGLGASVWSRDEARASRIARAIRSGAVFINAVVASDPRLPFGGVKWSGYGRELGAAGAIEFTNMRTYVAGAPQEARA